MVRSFVAPFLACVAASFVLAPVTVVTASPPQLYGINYNTRNGPDWAPAEQKCKSVADIDADLAVIASVTKRIRIYSLTDCDQGAVVLAAAKRHGLQVELGLWVSDTEAVFLAEKARLVELLQPNVQEASLITKERVTAIHVGSEAVYRKEVTAATIIEYMRQIKTIVTDRELGIPVTIADIGDVYLAHPELVKAVDFVSANGFPFWEKKPVAGAATYFHSRMQPLMDLAIEEKKDFVISETGWASDGVNVNASIASPGNAAQYLKEFHTLATQHQWKYYYFGAFDEPWKIVGRPENTVEGYFGIFHANRTIKSEFAGFETAVVPAVQLPQPTGGPTGPGTSTVVGGGAPGTTGQSTASTSNNFPPIAQGHPDCPL